MTLTVTTPVYDKPKTESTWQQGVNAFRAGKSFTECPYFKDLSHEHELDFYGWHNGWQYARSVWAKEQQR